MAKDKPPKAQSNEDPTPAASENDTETPPSAAGNASADAAAGAAPATAVTAAPPEPEAPAPAAPAPQAVEEKAQTFMQHLQSEIAAAEQTAKTDLHAWLLGLESHLGGLVTHCKRLEQEVSPEIQKFVAGVKSLL